MTAAGAEAAKHPLPPEKAVPVVIRDPLIEVGLQFVNLRTELLAEGNALLAEGNAIELVEHRFVAALDGAGTVSGCP